MIPGKVFFESIGVSQQLSKRYQIYLILNGIFYDKIKLFHTKYLCLTANDILEVQLGITQLIQQQESNNLKEIRNFQQAPQSFLKQECNLKVIVPQTYKLLIEGKTIELKFQLNKTNKNQSIKVNLAFQPVTFFNRKKLAANIPPINMSKNTTNRLAHFNNSSETNPNVFRFNEEDSISSNEELFPQQLNLNKKNPFSQLQSPVSNHSKAQTMKQQNFFINKNHQERLLKERGFSKQKNQRPSGLNPHQQFSQTIKSETFSDLFDKQINTSRSYNVGNRENIKISQNSNQESFKVNEKEFQTEEANYNYSEAPSQLDTLESLAYQREKILGELFGKFSHRNKK